MSTNLRTPNSLKKGPEYKEIEVSCTMVTVMGKGKSLRSNFPITLLLLLTIYKSKHSPTTERVSLVCLLSTAMLAYVVLEYRQNPSASNGVHTVRIQPKHSNFTKSQ